MKNCYYCDCDCPYDKLSIEHIIPNGIGGKLKSSDLLCLRCNSNLSKLDKLFCEELVNFVVLLNPKRDNDRSDPKITANNGMEMSAKGNICKDWEIDIILNDNKNAIEAIKMASINKDWNDAEKIIKGKLKGLKVNNDKSNEILKKCKAEYDDRLLSLSPILHFNMPIDLLKLSPALMKIAIGFALYNGFEKLHLEDSIKLLQKNTCITNIKFDYQNDIYPKDEIHHTLILMASEINKKVYFFSSFFGCVNSVILINDRYEGKDSFAIYSYDLINNCEIELEVDPKTLLMECSFDSEVFKDKFQTFMKFCNQKRGLFMSEDFLPRQRDKILSEVQSFFDEENFITYEEFKKRISNLYYFIPIEVRRGEEFESFINNIYQDTIAKYLKRQDVQDDLSKISRSIVEKFFLPENFHKRYDKTFKDNLIIEFKENINKFTKIETFRSSIINIYEPMLKNFLNEFTN